MIKGLQPCQEVEGRADYRKTGTGGAARRIREPCCPDGAKARNVWAVNGSELNQQIPWNTDPLRVIATLGV